MAAAAGASSVASARRRLLGGPVRHMAGAFKAAARKAPLARGPAISVVVPAYNDEAYVERAVRSCVGQGYANLELVCVDDGSADATLSILERLAAEVAGTGVAGTGVAGAGVADAAAGSAGGRRARMKVVSLGRNVGPHGARRAGLAEAQGELVAFLDADDELAAGACVEIARQYQEKPFDILHFAMAVRRDGAASAAQAADMVKWTTPVAGELAGRDILTRSFADLDYSFSLCGKAYRTSVAKRAFEALDAALAPAMPAMPAAPAAPAPQPPDGAQAPAAPGGDATLLDFGEDALEYFAIGYFSQHYRGIPDRRLYVYHLGDGASALRDVTAAGFERPLRGIRSVEAMRAFLVRQGALGELGSVYEAHRAGQLGALLRSWREDVRESDREEVLGRILELWPQAEVVEAMCALGTEAVEALRRRLGDDLVLTEEQVYCMGRADGEARARAEYEASASYRIGRLATFIPRQLRNHLLK